MNLYMLLHQDHAQAKSLFSQLEDSAEDEQDRRERLFSTLFRELTIHSEAEERYFYSRLKSNDESRESTLASLQDHKEMKLLMSALEAMDTGTPEWTAKCRELREDCEAHIAREEEELFPLARRILEDEEAAGIAEDIQAFKEQQSEIGVF